MTDAGPDAGTSAGTNAGTFGGLHVLVHPGDGIVAVFGSAVFACLPTTASQQRATSELLSLVERAASAEAMPGRVVAQAAAELLGRTAPTDVPPFAVLSPVDDGLAVMLQGDVELEVHQAGGRNIISGREAITWVERVIRGSFDRIEVRRADGQSTMADGRSRLDRGIVPGSGLTIVPAAAPAAYGAPPPGPAAAVPTSFAPPTGGPPHPAPPSPVAPQPVVAAVPPPPGSPLAPPAPPPPFGAPPGSPPGPPPGAPPGAPPGPPPGVPSGPPPGLGPPPVMNPMAPPPSVPPPSGPPPAAPLAPPPAAPAIPPPAPIMPPASAPGPAMPPPGAPAPLPPPAPPVTPPTPPMPVAATPAPLATPPAPPVATGTPPAPPSAPAPVGPPPAPAAPAPAPAPAPPPPPPSRPANLGVLIGDDGSRIELDGNYILGREPFEHPDVTGGTARPFLFLDTESEISRAHTRVSVANGQVTITDLKSANGTYIAVPGANEWQGLVAHTPTPIAPGTRILIGQRTFVYHPG